MELCVIEGDGIGREVIPAAVKVLLSVADDIVIKAAPAGWDYFQEYGTALPDETLMLARQCGALLFGSASTPSYPVEGYMSPIMRLRQEMGAYANVRPTRYLPVVTAREGIDLIVVLESWEDFHAGQQHPGAQSEMGVTEKVVTRQATERFAEWAYEMTAKAGRKKVTIVHKANVMQHSDGLFRRVALEVAERHPGIETDELLVDTAAYWMVKDPTRFDVIVTSRLYGDILSDMAAAWGGGIGLSPSLSIGDGAAIAEPIHGSAPDIAGRGIANPTAAILSMAMLLRHHWGRPEVARRVEKAVYVTLEGGGYTADIQIEDAVSTAVFAERVCAYLSADAAQA